MLIAFVAVLVLFIGNDGSRSAQPASVPAKDAVMSLIDSAFADDDWA